jgi:hypothetical protein
LLLKLLFWKLLLAWLIILICEYLIIMILYLILRFLNSLRYRKYNIGDVSNSITSDRWLNLWYLRLSSRLLYLWITLIIIHLLKIRSLCHLNIRLILLKINCSSGYNSFTFLITSSFLFLLLTALIITVISLLFISLFSLVAQLNSCRLI